jgi:hypothetical protein
MAVVVLVVAVVVRVQVLGVRRVTFMRGMVRRAGVMAVGAGNRAAISHTIYRVTVLGIWVMVLVGREE